MLGIIYYGKSRRSMYLHRPKAKVGRWHDFILDGAGILLHFYEISDAHLTFWGWFSPQLLHQCLAEYFCPSWITPLTTNMDMQNNCAENVSTFKYSHFLVSMFNFWGVVGWLMLSSSLSVDPWGLWYRYAWWSVVNSMKIWPMSRVSWEVHDVAMHGRLDYICIFICVYEYVYEYEWYKHYVWWTTYQLGSTQAETRIRVISVAPAITNGQHWR